ncbi:hypothetical protein [Proteocatella sphenisci]|uniref:hypothetical protein n=1 Tax=Proteocatella sphenisci TaxID=181070 RepID=UPI00048CE52A|nr:hypothetical protein [Proteocatella sphenisci]
MSKKIIRDTSKNNNTNKAKTDRNVEKNKNTSNKPLVNQIKYTKLTKFVKKNKRLIAFAMGALIMAISVYYAYYMKIPSLDETHKKAINGGVESYDGDIHPFEILSSNRERMTDFRGAPESKGDAKTQDTKFVVYKLKWFGKTRETVMFYDNNEHFNRIKLNVGNESAKDLSEKLILNFGEPFESQSPQTKGGYAIWIKDAVQYKLVHHGSYATIEMKLARYENTNKLPVGDAPVVIQRLFKQDVNKDGNLESIILVGNRKNSLSADFKKLYLIVWDGKTHIGEMAEGIDGGLYPQIEFYDTDKDEKNEIVVSGDNNGVVKNYNVFRYDGDGLELIYSGYDEP